jgi:hypothetical protein
VTGDLATGPAGGRQRAPAMRFSVDGWDPSYGMSLEVEEQLGESTARVETGVELPGGQWRAIDPDPAAVLPPALLFVDGVRRIEARVWIDDEVPGGGGGAGPGGAGPGGAGERPGGGPGGGLSGTDLAGGDLMGGDLMPGDLMGGDLMPGDLMRGDLMRGDLAGGGPATDASAALCASYAAGVVCCCERQAHVILVEARRGLFTVARHARDIATWAGNYPAYRTAANPAVPLSVTLSAALQRRLGEVEVATAIAARAALAGHGVPPGSDLLVVDGPLRGRQHLPRALGYIKSHRASYLPPALNALVGALAPGQRTPVFLMGTSWDRHTWYLRLPGGSGAPWAGVVRIECSADLKAPEAIELAALSQRVLGRFASAAYKDSRAPQNLYPIAGLERELRRRLGDPRVLYRALRQSAQAAAPS